MKIDLPLRRIGPRRGIHRVTPDSVNGRRMTSAKGAIEVGRSHLTDEQRAWNEKVEAERRARGKA